MGLRHSGVGRRCTRSGIVSGGWGRHFGSGHFGSCAGFGSRGAVFFSHFARIGALLGGRSSRAGCHGTGVWGPVIEIRRGLAVLVLGLLGLKSSGLEIRALSHSADLGRWVACSGLAAWWFRRLGSFVPLGVLGFGGILGELETVGAQSACLVPAFWSSSGAGIVCESALSPFGPPFRGAPSCGSWRIRHQRSGDLGSVSTAGLDYVGAFSGWWVPSNWGRLIPRFSGTLNSLAVFGLFGVLGLCALGAPVSMRVVRPFGCFGSLDLGAWVQGARPGHSIPFTQS